MRRLMLLAVSILIVVSMTVSPALAHDRDRDGCDEDIWWCDKFDRDFDDHRFVWWPWWWWGHQEVCWWEWSWVFGVWELECD